MITLLQELQLLFSVAVKSAQILQVLLHLAREYFLYIYFIHISQSVLQLILILIPYATLVRKLDRECQCNHPIRLVLLNIFNRLRTCTDKRHSD